MMWVQGMVCRQPWANHRLEEVMSRLAEVLNPRTTELNVVCMRHLEQSGGIWIIISIHIADRKIRRTKTSNAK